MALTWLITGCSRGLGLQTARAALANGDNVVATARQQASLDALATEFGDRVCPTTADVTDRETIVRAAAAGAAAFGSIDVVMCNAGFSDSAALEDVSDEHFRAQLETNFFGMVNTVRATLPMLREQGSGHYLQMSSICGRISGVPGLGAYYASKYAIEGYSEVLASEVNPLGITVTIVEPGAFRTEFIRNSTHVTPSPAYEQTVLARQLSRKVEEKNFPGDPVRAGQVIAGIPHLAAPPFRMLLGSDAIRYVRAVHENGLRELEQWAEMSQSTDYPEFAGTDTRTVASMLRDQG